MTERAEHTAGPWDYCKSHKRWLVYPKSALNDGIDYFIAEAINVDGREQEAKANARLIAAAPDLLAALKAIQWFCDDPNGSEKGETLANGLVRLLPAARAAISKATGEA